MELNKELAQAAKNKGICEDWFNDLMNTKDKGRLIQMYLKGIDFCLSNEYPSLSFIRENFVGAMEPYGVFLDEEIKAENFRHVVALGNCYGTAVYSGFEVGQVFAKHNAKLTVTAKDNSFVMIDVFDNAEVEVIASDNAKICVNHYGGRVISNSSEPGNSVIKIIRKHSKTY